MMVGDVDSEVQARGSRAKRYIAVNLTLGVNSKRWGSLAFRVRIVGCATIVALLLMHLPTFTTEGDQRAGCYLTLALKPIVTRYY